MMANTEQTEIPVAIPNKSLRRKVLSSQATESRENCLSITSSGSNSTCCDTLHKTGIGENDYTLLSEDEETPSDISFSIDKTVIPDDVPTAVTADHDDDDVDVDVVNGHECANNSQQPLVDNIQTSEVANNSDDAPLNDSIRSDGSLDLFELDDVADCMKKGPKRSSSSGSDGTSCSKKIKIDDPDDKTEARDTTSKKSVDSPTKFSIATSNPSSSSPHKSESSGYFEAVEKKVLEQVSLIIDKKKEEVEVLTQGSLSIEHLLKSNNCPLCLRWFDKIMVHVKNCAAKNKIPTDKLFDAIKLQLKQHQEREAIGLPPLAQQPLTKKKKKTASKKKTTAITAAPEGYNSSIELAKALSISSMENQESLGNSKVDNHTESEVIQQSKDAVCLQSKKANSTAPIFGSASSGSSSNKWKGGTSLLFNRTDEDRERIVTEKVAIVLLHNDDQDNLITEESAPVIPKSSKMKENHNKDETNPKQMLKSCKDYSERSQSPIPSLKPTKPINLPISVCKLIKSSRDYRNNWRNLLKDKVMCDITVVVDESYQIEVHKLVLRVQCPVILDEVVVRFTADNIAQNYIMWCATPKVVASAFFEYIYCDDLSSANDLSEVQLSNFKQLVEKYNINGLKFIHKDVPNDAPNLNSPPIRDVDEASTETNSSFDEFKKVTMGENSSAVQCRATENLSPIVEFDLLEDLDETSSLFRKIASEQHVVQSNSIPKSLPSFNDITRTKSKRSIRKPTRNNCSSPKETLTIDSNSGDSVRDVEIIGENKKPEVVITLSDDSDCELDKKASGNSKDECNSTRQRSSGSHYKKMYESDSDVDESNRNITENGLNLLSSCASLEGAENISGSNNRTGLSDILKTFQNKIDLINKIPTRTNEASSDPLESNHEDDFGLPVLSNKSVPKSVYNFDPQMPSTSRAADLFEAWVAKLPPKSSELDHHNKDSSSDILGSLSFGNESQSKLDKTNSDETSITHSQSMFRNAVRRKMLKLSIPTPLFQYTTQSEDDKVTQGEKDVFTHENACSAFEQTQNRPIIKLSNSFKPFLSTSMMNPFSSNESDNYPTRFHSNIGPPEGQNKFGKIFKAKCQRKRHCSATVTSGELADYESEERKKHKSDSNSEADSFSKSKESSETESTGPLNGSISMESEVNSSVEKEKCNVSSTSASVSNSIDATVNDCSNSESVQGESKASNALVSSSESSTKESVLDSSFKQGKPNATTVPETSAETTNLSENKKPNSTITSSDLADNELELYNYLKLREADKNLSSKEDTPGTTNLLESEKSNVMASSNDDLWDYEPVAIQPNKRKSTNSVFSEDVASNIWTPFDYNSTQKERVVGAFYDPFHGFSKTKEEKQPKATSDAVIPLDMSMSALDEEKKSHVIATSTINAAGCSSNYVWDEIDVNQFYPLADRRDSLLRMDEEIFTQVKTPETSMSSKTADENNLGEIDQRFAPTHDSYSMHKKYNDEHEKELPAWNGVRAEPDQVKVGVVVPLQVIDPGPAALVTQEAQFTLPNQYQTAQGIDINNVIIERTDSPKPNFGKMRKKELMEQLERYGVRSNMTVPKAKRLLTHIYKATHQKLSAAEKKKNLSDVIAKNVEMALTPENLKIEPLNDYPTETPSVPPNGFNPIERSPKVSADNVSNFFSDKDAQPALSNTYRELLELEKQNTIFNVEPMECPTCFDDIDAGGGVILKDCTHFICRDCLSRLVETSDETTITCPSCPSVIQQREFKGIVAAEVFERFLTRSLSITANSIDNAFHCKKPDCRGWCIIDDVINQPVNEFHCPICHTINCIQCQATHPKMNCLQYQNHLAIQAEKDPVAKKSLLYLEKLKKSKKALNCPKCNVIIVKTEGCDWIQCAMCKCEICWATMGPRWGPMGRLDWSGGCRCRYNDGPPCTKKCRNCH